MSLCEEIKKKKMGGENLQYWQMKDKQVTYP